MPDAGALAVIGEPDRPPRTRHASDLPRLVVALVGTLLGFLLATVLTSPAEAVTIEVIELVDGLPTAGVIGL